MGSCIFWSWKFKKTIICSNNITYTYIISRQPYYLRRSVSNLEKK